MSTELCVEGDRGWVCPQQARVVTSEPSSVGAEVARKETQLAEKGSNVPRPGAQSSLQQLRVLRALSTGDSMASASTMGYLHHTAFVIGDISVCLSEPVSSCGPIHPTEQSEH